EIEESLSHRSETSRLKSDRNYEKAALAEPVLSLSNGAPWRAVPGRIDRGSCPLKSQARRPRGELRLQEALDLPLSTPAGSRCWQDRILCRQRVRSILRSRLDHPV